MDQLPSYGDERQTSNCVYCGGDTGTADHVPSKVLLDEPYPENLPVVPACPKCNEGFSLDEEYVACLIECACVGSVRASDIRRERIRRILQSRPVLASRLIRVREDTPTGISFNIEHARVRNVVLKLARGHAAFELNEPQRDEPTNVAFFPLVSMPPADRDGLETPPRSLVWPEVGSRAMHRLVVDDPGVSPWIVVQLGRYRYLASVSNGILIRFVIGDYLGCQVTWD